MASIFLDPEKLQRKIDSLQAMADECKRVNILLDADSESHGDPYLKFTDFYEAVPEAARTVADRANTIKNIKDKIVQLNQNGVGVKDKETGTITCEIPEGVTIESKEGFDQWAQGATDAHDLQQLAKSGKNKTKDGRTYDEVIASMEANKSNPNHTNSFIDTVGAENLTSLPLSVSTVFDQSSTEYGGTINTRPDAGPDLADLLGTMLATSSTTWGADKSQSVAEEIRSSVDEEGEYGRITVLNAMIGGHDADGNGVTDLRFGTDFLVSMGEEMEKVDLEKVQRAVEDSQNDGAYQSGYGDVSQYAKRVVGGHFSEESFDPLAGVLDAMGGNAEAASRFIAPEGESPSEVDLTRYHRLMERKWDERGLEGFTAAVAAVSSLRGSENADEAERARVLSGNAIHDFATKTEEAQYTDNAKARIGLLLANSPAELTQVGNKGDFIDPSVKRPKLLTSANDAKELMWRISDNSIAVATISATLGDYAKNKASQGVSVHNGNPELQKNQINYEYDRGSCAIGLLAGMADAKAEADSKVKDDVVQADSATAQTALNVFSTVLGAGLSAVSGPAAPVVNTAWSAGSTLAVPVLADKGKAVEVESVAPENLDNGMWAASVQEAANAGLLKPTDFADVTDSEGNQYSWIVTDEEGNYTIDLSKADDLGEAYREMSNWESAINTTTEEEAERKENGEEVIKHPDPLLTDFKRDRVGVYTNGYVDGRNYKGEGVG
ncbi:DUF6571 family protein [Actinomyces bowdenii]|uniref:DUF6571 domain-containing protein n=1 Tax=Actinomyces bowdenii TaxID=131109 RepID=A0A853EJV1_9ACTO|nr:DUF6571 family protein [Actinomyces bowdenii]MBF0697385.1 hypothetical protein [Actinomyces bowdenii]NYS69558.1 hypothetical protein [Actinomyces bowdenii]